MKKSTLLNILENWKNPYFFRNKLLYKLVSFLYRKVDGFDIFEETWDNLIILDACRYDFFKEAIQRSKIKGKLKLKISKGSHTISFLTRNFDKTFYDEIVYLTANPHVDMLFKAKFYKISQTGQ